MRAHGAAVLGLLAGATPPPGPEVVECFIAAMRLTLANGAPHPIVAPFGLERFSTGRLVDESTAAAVSH